MPGPLARSKISEFKKYKCGPTHTCALFRLNVYSMLCTVCSTMCAARRVLICCVTYTMHFHLMSAPSCVCVVYYTSVPLRATLRPASAAFGELHTASLFPPTRGAAATLPPHGRGGNLFALFRCVLSILCPGFRGFGHSATALRTLLAAAQQPAGPLPPDAEYFGTPFRECFGQNPDHSGPA